MRVSVSALLVALLLPVAASAAPDCDITIAPSEGILDGELTTIAPGDVVCIEAGEREFLRVRNVHGTEDAPVVIINSGGQVVIDNTERGYGLTLDASSFLQITGTGDPAFDYGFKIRASRDGPDYSASCIVAAGLSTDYELDHLEAYECGFAGVSAKTDPTCDDRDLSDFVQRNSRLHHLYLHDTGGEGIYFGSTGFPTRERTCDGQTVDLVPHSHEGVWIHDNIIEDTGWDGAQIGVSPKDCFFYRNRIARVGLDGEQYQMQGLQIGGGSACFIEDNFISSGPAVGIIVLDAASTLIANNVITGFLDGVYINDRDSEVSQDAQYRVLYNTVTTIEERGITIFGTRSVDNAFVNNLLVDAGTSPLGISGEVDATDEGNLILDTLAEASFVDAAADDFMLLENSPAVDAGVDASAWEITDDQRGAERDAAPDAGAFEFGVEAPDEPEGPPPAGSNPGSGPGVGAGGVDGGDSDSGGGNEEGGCSCRQAPYPGQGLAWLLGLGLVLVAWSRRRMGRKA